MRFQLLPISAMILFFYSSVQSMNTISRANHAGVKRAHPDFDHVQGGPLKKKRLLVLGQTQGVMKIITDKPWRYLNDLAQAKKIISFLKLNLTDAQTHYDSERDKHFDNQIMVPITIKQLDQSLQAMPNDISNGFKVKYDHKESFYLHSWFPEYLPYELVIKAINTSPLPLLIEKKCGRTQRAYTKMLLYCQDGPNANFNAESDSPEILIELHNQYDNFFSQARCSDLSITVDVMEL